MQELDTAARGFVATHSYTPASFLVVCMIISSCRPSGQEIMFILASISKGFLSEEENVKYITNI